MMQKNKSILLISSSRFNGAITEYFVSTARCLGTSAQVMALKNSFAEKRLAEHGIKTLAFNLSSLKILKQHSHVFCFQGKEMFLVWFLSLFIKNHPKLYRLKGDDFKPGFKNLLFYFLHKSKNVTVVYPSHTLEKKFVYADKIKSVVIPLGIDTQIFYPNNRKAECTLLIFGRLDPVKGILEFLDIFKKVLEIDQNQNLILKIVGLAYNTTEASVLDKIKSLNLENHIELRCEKVTDRAKLLSSTTLGVVPSLGSEWIARVTEEFLLCGTPVLVSDVGSLKEFVLDGVCLDFKDEHLPQKIIDAIKKFQNEDFNQRKERASKAKQLYSLEAMADHLMDDLFN